MSLRILWESESAQSATINTLWALEMNPTRVVETIAWEGSPVHYDSWVWVHFVHGFLAWGVLFQDLVLLVITFRNLRVRKFWIGDAFVAISSSLVLRGLVVIASMAMNKFWAFKAFCLSQATIVSSGNQFVDEQIVHVDLLAIYLSLVGLLGKLFKERIDPALTAVMFELGFQFRTDFLALSPSLMKVVTATGLADFAAGVGLPDDEALSISPMLLWGPHKMRQLPLDFYAAILIPIVVTLFPLVSITLAKKASCTWSRRRSANLLDDNRVIPFSNDSSNMSGQGGSETPSLRTNFELATGAHLADQFGLVSDYETYKHIRGLRFASAGGVYSNGFVIVNNKFLVQTDDLFTIAMMRLLRIRFRNVYVYEVHEHSVGMMARLVYPDTMTFSDLCCIDINVLT